MIASFAFADDIGVAEQLFREGKRLMAEGKVADACRAFEGSYNKDQAPSTLLNLADCHEKNGKFASAWAAFIEAERRLRQDSAQAALHDVARDRAAALEPRLSRLRIAVPDAVAVDGLEIRRGATLLERAEWNTAIVVDGGEYTIEVRAPGREAWTTTISMASERDNRTVDVPLLSAHAMQSGTTQPATTRPTRRGNAPWLVVGGGGVVVVGSLVVGYLAKRKLDEAKGLCGDDLHCDSEADQSAGQALIDGSRLRGNIATGLAIGGALAVGAGVVWWFTSRSGQRRTATREVSLQPLITPTLGGVALVGEL